MRNGRPSGIRLFLVLLVAMASFMTSTAVSELSNREVHARTQDISTNALPSIEHLATLRTELFHERLLLERDLRATAEERPVVRSELRDARAQVDQELADYLSVPSLPEEDEHTTAVALQHQVAALDAQLDSLPAARGSDPQELVGRLEPELDQASTTCMALIAMNSDQAASLSQAIDRSRKRSVRLSWALDVVSALLSLAVALLAWRALKYQLDVQESQQALLGARADELEAFSARVAHDILNPLNAVSVGLALLERGAEPKTVVPKAQNSLRRAHRIIEALLAFARSGARPEPGGVCELRPVLEGVMADAAELARERGVTLELHADDARVACLPGVLASLAGNLVSNAVKYLSDSIERKVTVRAERRSGTVLVEVEDTGPGIELSLQRTLFEPYVRGKDRSQPGMGLGLATAKKLCESHGGHIGVRSAPGAGSTFWFELPEAAA